MEKVFIKTYGCAFNQLDSEIMAGNLKKDNFTITQNEEDATLILINSCTVKNMSETKFFNDIKKYKEKGKKILVSGCISQAEKTYLNTKLNGISVIGTNDLDKVSLVAKSTLNNQPIQLLSNLSRTRKENERIRKEKENIRLNTKKVRQNKLVEIIPINEGCLNACTFCKTKQARGNLFSYSIESIKESMQTAINQGAKEIYLTSQDIACYGFDIKTNLPNLLRELLKIEGDYKIRIGMGNPNHFKKIINEVLEIMKQDNRIYRFLHIPIQSGNNRILQEMRRGYTKEDYDEIIEKCHNFDDKITIANDIIVAYPTESQEEFEDTLKSMIKNKTNVLNFSRFWLRPNTPCDEIYKKEDFIDGLESKRRAKILKQEFEKIAYNQNKKWLNWQGEITITELGKKGTSSYIGRNNYYKPIVVITDKKLEIGEKVKIKINKVTWFDFRAELIE